MISLIGPGGSGKSTCGRLLAAELGSTFIDLDQEFISRIGDIAQHIARQGYKSYARCNVSLFLSIEPHLQAQDVLVLSSGFMCYNINIHQDYGACRDQILNHDRTYCILASHEFIQCIDETVRRQMQRPYLKTSPDRQREIIMERYPLYGGLTVKHVENWGNPIRAVNLMIADIRANKLLERTPLRGATQL